MHEIEEIHEENEQEDIHDDGNVPDDDLNVKQMNAEYQINRIQNMNEMNNLANQVKKGKGIEITHSKEKEDGAKLEQGMAHNGEEEYYEEGQVEIEGDGEGDGEGQENEGDEIQDLEDYQEYEGENEGENEAANEGENEAENEGENEGGEEGDNEGENVEEEEEE